MSGLSCSDQFHCHPSELFLSLSLAPHAVKRIKAEEAETALKMGDEVSGVRAMVDDLGEGMHCSDHPYRTNPGSICAFCLQEKLGKLVSSSKSSDPFVPIPPPLSSSSSPTSSPPSDFPVSTTPSVKHHRSKKKKPVSSSHSTAVRLPKVESTPNACDIVLWRNKSVYPRPYGDTFYRPRKKSFWSFLTLSYPSFTSITSSTALPSSVIAKRRSISSTSCLVAETVKNDKRTPRRVQDKAPASASAIGLDDHSLSRNQAPSTFNRKMARSRSVGCGSRSFSGDFLERISKGLGDCAFRRVESHRETKPMSSFDRHQGHDNVEYEEKGIKDQIKCGGLIDSLSTISSSMYLLHAASATDAFNDRLPAKRRGGVLHGLGKSWASAFANPMRAFRSI